MSKSTPTRKKRTSKVIHVLTDPVVQGINVAVIETGKKVKKLKVACVFPDGSHGSGKDAELYPHMEPHLKARRKDEIVWHAAEPFRVTLKKGADAFVRPQPWDSTPNGGVHTVTTGAIVANHPKLKAGKSVKAKFTITVPRPDVEEYDPHFVVDP